MTDFKNNNDLEAKNEASGRMVKSILSQSKNPFIKKAAQSIRQGANIGEALQFVADNVQELPTNSVVGNLFVLIAQQWVESHFRKIYGNIFKRGEDLIGGGITISLFPNNALGTSTPINYQTSQLSTGEIAFGESVSNADLISVNAVVAPLMNFGSKQPLSYLPFRTISLTVPETFASFSALTPIKADEIINNYIAQLQNNLQIYYNSLGNLLFTDLLPSNQYTTTSTNIYDMLQKVLLPIIEGMKQFSARFNAGINYTSLMGVTLDGAYINNLYSIPTETLQQQTWTTSLPAWESTNNSISASQPYLNNMDPDKLVMYMNPNTMAAFLTLIETNAIGRNVVNIETSGNMVTRIGGVRVVVTGTLVNPTPQTPQGTTIRAGLDSGQALGDGMIVLIDEDYLTFHKWYEKQYETSDMVAAMVKLIKLQVAYLPIVKPWLNGIVLNINSCLSNINALNVNILSQQ